MLPAPQALLRTTRPDRLPTTPADVIGFNSGNLRHTLSHIASLLLTPERLQRYHVQYLRIERANKERPPVVTAATWGPMTWLAIASFVIFLALLAFAIGFKDREAIFALLLLGLVSILAHAGLFHSVELVAYKKKRAVLPKSEVVVVYPNGTFQMISCDEEIARKLFVETETCVYKVNNDNIYRLIATVATITLMIGVICLSNASQELQFLFACTLVTLNAAHWAVAALPEQMHWDLRSFRVEEINRWATERYSQTLWTVIASTGSTRWMRSAKVAPDTPAWDDWLDEAQRHLDPSTKPEFRNGIMVKPSWDAQAALSRLLSKYEVLDTDSSLGSTKDKE